MTKITSLSYRPLQIHEDCQRLPFSIVSKFLQRLPKFSEDNRIRSRFDSLPTNVNLLDISADATISISLKK